MSKNSKKSVVHIDEAQMTTWLKEAEMSFSTSLTGFDQKLAKIAVNEINLDKILQSIIVLKLPLKAHDNDTLLIAQQGPRKVKIEKTNADAANKVYQAARTALTSANLIVKEEGDVILAELQPTTSEARAELVKEAKAARDHVKNTMNNIRREFMHRIKDAPESLRKRGEKQIDRIKDDTQSKAEKAFTNKERRLMND